MPYELLGIVSNFGFIAFLIAFGVLLKVIKRNKVAEKTSDNKIPEINENQVW